MRVLLAPAESPDVVVGWAGVFQPSPSADHRHDEIGHIKSSSAGIERIGTALFKEPGSPWPS